MAPRIHMTAQARQSEEGLKQSTHGLPGCLRHFAPSKLVWKLPKRLQEVWQDFWISSFGEIIEWYVPLSGLAPDTELLPNSSPFS